MKKTVKNAYNMLVYLSEQAGMHELVRLLRKHIEPIILTIADDEEEK